MSGKKSYAVLYGARGVKSFSSINDARRYARDRANRLGSKVSIDELDDSAQWHREVISPGGKVARKYISTKGLTKRFRVGRTSF
jgi:hypothetical protein